MQKPPRIAFYGDDFTGSTDTLMGLASAGLRALLFVAPPTAAELDGSGQLDAVGIAGHARSLSPAEMDKALPPAFASLAATGARVLHYKTCSTFDSAPHIGSIGHAIGIGRRFVKNAFVPIVAGQPNLGRYCAFGNLFAIDRQGGSVSRIDRHPTMSRHPVTPMHEADLRLHLREQGLARIASFDLTALEAPPDSHDRSLTQLLEGNPDAVLFDLTAERHMSPIGSLIWQQALAAPVLMAGPTGAAQTLLAHWRATGELTARAAPAIGSGPVDPLFVISGSLSPVTAGQIATARSRGFEILDLDATSLAASPQADGAAIQSAVAAVIARLDQGKSIVASIASRVVEDGPAQTRVGERLAAAVGAILAAVLERRPMRRVGVAGGDTSSLAVRALPIRALEFAYSIGPGCGVCRMHAPGKALDGIEILLKGGQMGNATVFADLRAGRAP